MEKKIRVYELARELKVENKEVLNAAKKLGIDVGNHMSSFTNEDKMKVIHSLSKGNKGAGTSEEPKQQKEKSAEEKKMPKKSHTNTTSVPKHKKEAATTEKKDKRHEKKQKSMPAHTTKKESQREDKRGEKPQEGFKKSEGFKKKETKEDLKENKSKNKKGKAVKSDEMKEHDTDRKKGKKFNKKSDRGNKKNETQAMTESGYHQDKMMKPSKGKKQNYTNKKEKELKPEMSDVIKQEDGIFEIGETIVVGDLAQLLNIPATDVIMGIMKMGIMANINQSIKFETAEKIALEHDVILFKKQEEKEEVDFVIEEDKEEDLTSRPPIVTVMGHVDHGKTTLLDSIRNTKVTQGEAGGITQHIGASEVMINGKKIVFLDTPGHEAFTEMRARGAQVTDIVIIVVAADDGIMPQTIEAIDHVKAAGVPMIIAINKIDKPTANVERVRQELSEKNILVEAWGGTTIDVPVSAKSGENIDSLLEMVLIVAEMEELKANPNRNAVGTIVESKLDKGRGSVATLIVQNGTLKEGDSVVAGTAYGRVRAMLNSKGKRIKKAGPSTAVEIQGLNSVPDAGDQFFVVSSDKEARALGTARQERKREEHMKETSKISLEDLFERMQSGEMKELNIIVKADVQGSIDAIKKSFEKMTNEEVVVKVIHGSVGAISESDVMLASASNAIIIGFNVRPSTGATSLAEREKVDMRTYRIIYDAIEDVEKAMKGMLSPEFVEELLGKAEVRTPFKVPKVGVVAGSYVIEGKIQRNAKVRLVRDGIVIYEGEIDSLKRFKDDVKEVSSGYECGIGLTNYNDIKEGDIIENYIIKEIKKA